jgi:hypothetical protein
MADRRSSHTLAGRHQAWKLPCEPGRAAFHPVLLVVVPPHHYDVQPQQPPGNSCQAAPSGAPTATLGCQDNTGKTVGLSRVRCPHAPALPRR